MSFDCSVTQLEDQITEGVNADGIGSIAVEIVQGDEQIYARAFGWANSDKQIQAGVETVYRVGSISKCFTGVLLLQLCERDIVALDDRIENYLPEIRTMPNYVDQVPITFRQLASHSAGLIREPKLPDAAVGPIEGWEDKVIASIPTADFEFTPHTRFSYSNIGYGILGLALSRAEGKPFMDLVTKWTIDPLGLTSSSFILTPEQWSHLATGYVVDKDGKTDAEIPFTEHSGRGYKVPNGGIYSTVGDLGRFIAVQTNALPVEILSLESRKEMQQNQTPEKALPAYGLGFRVQEGYGDRLFFGHGGSVAGYNASLLFEPQSKLGIVMLRNYDRSTINLKELSAEILRKLVAEV